MTLLIIIFLLLCCLVLFAMYELEKSEKELSQILYKDQLVKTNNALNANHKLKEEMIKNQKVKLTSSDLDIDEKHQVG